MYNAVDFLFTFRYVVQPKINTRIKDYLELEN